MCVFVSSTVLLLAFMYVWRRKLTGGHAWYVMHTLCSYCSWQRSQQMSKQVHSLRRALRQANVSGTALESAVKRAQATATIASDAHSDFMAEVRQTTTAPLHAH